MLRAIDEAKPLTLGILGGGQLAKMLALEAYRLGLNVAIIDKDANTPAGDLTKLDFTKGWNDQAELDKFVEVSDIITLENEFIEPEILEYISQKKQVFPTAQTMRLVQDKFIQKNVFAKNGIPLPRYEEINSIDDLKQFGQKFGYPFVVKTRTLGYDGYGNFTVQNENECQVAWQKFNSNSNQSPARKLMAEEFINFKAELAVMITRSRSGKTAVYPCVETIQKNHICNQVIAPAKIDIDISLQAQEIATRAVEAVNGVGVFGVELFVNADGQILVNEIAPRPHNSGHYTIEACFCSQFENAIRAILDLPLGSTEMIKPAACMINLLGERDGIGSPTNVTNTLEFNKVALHLYNKKTSRQGRKMGHITAIADNIDDAINQATAAFNKFSW